jgi:hypothetical protein
MFFVHQKYHISPQLTVITFATSIYEKLYMIMTVDLGAVRLFCILGHTNTVS